MPLFSGNFSKAASTFDFWPISVAPPQLMRSADELCRVSIRIKLDFVIEIDSRSESKYLKSAGICSNKAAIEVRSPLLGL